MTPREAAKDHIRFYVERGDSAQHLNESWMGQFGPHYRAEIRSWKVKVQMPDWDRDRWVSFPLQELYDEIVREVRGEPVQAPLL